MAVDAASTSAPGSDAGPGYPSTAADPCVPHAAHLERAFRFLGKRWNAVVLGHLAAGSAGFRELSRAIFGISDSMLSDRLTELTAGGLVSRTVEAGPPIAVSYALTERGRALMPALEQIAHWAGDHLPEDACRTAEAAQAAGKGADSA